MWTGPLNYLTAAVLHVLPPLLPVFAPLPLLFSLFSFFPVFFRLSLRVVLPGLVPLFTPLLVLLFALHLVLDSTFVSVFISLSLSVPALVFVPFPAVVPVTAVLFVGALPVPMAFLCSVSALTLLLLQLGVFLLTASTAL